MKLGLLTDIHERVDYLAAALKLLHHENVDRIVVIGDLYETGDHLDETCELLAEANVVGVWGNHDFGLCVNPERHVFSRFRPQTMDYMATLEPRLVIEQCHFSHVEPWLDPNEITDIWYFKGEPDKPESLDRIFDAVPEHLMFCGHNHRWLLATRDAVSDWRGEHEVDLSQSRHFVVIGPLCEGQFATLDTSTSTLTPKQVRQADG